SARRWSQSFREASPQSNAARSWWRPRRSIAQGGPEGSAKVLLVAARRGGQGLIQPGARVASRRLQPAGIAAIQTCEHSVQRSRPNPWKRALRCRTKPRKVSSRKLGFGGTSARTAAQWGIDLAQAGHAI